MGVTKNDNLGFSAVPSLISRKSVFLTGELGDKNIPSNSSSTSWYIKLKVYRKSLFLNPSGFSLRLKKNSSTLFFLSDKSISKGFVAVIKSLFVLCGRSIRAISPNLNTLSFTLLNCHNPFHQAF